MNVFALSIVIVLALFAGQARAQVSSDTLSAGFWVIIGVASLIALILVIMLIWWCCVPTRAISERPGVDPGKETLMEAKGQVWGSPTAYDAAMNRMKWGIPLPASRRPQ